MLKKVVRFAQSIAVCLVLLWFGLDRGLAQTFTPIGPPLCGSSALTEQNWVWDTIGDSAVERHFNDGNNYHNDQATLRRFVANYRLSNVGFRVAERSIVSGDQLILKQYGRPVGDQRTVIGTSPTPIWMDVPSGSLQNPIEMTFASNGSGVSTGFRIDRVRYCGLPVGPAPPQDILSGERYSGVLLGTNDVVFRAIMGPPVGRRLHVATWGGSFNANQDIYVRCGAPPTPTNFLRRTNSSTPNDFLYVTYNECPSPQKVYIAINSNSGSGMFNLVAQQRGITLHGEYASEGGAPADIAVVVDTLMQAKRLIFGLTEGEVLITPIDLYRRAPGMISDTYTSCATSCSGNVCDGCFLQDQIRSKANNSVFLISGNDWHLPRTVAHEMGHVYINTFDEYADVIADFDGDGDTELGSPQFCGHSQAAMLVSSNYCTNFNHGLDAHPLVTLGIFVDPGEIWDGWFADYIYNGPTTTPDVHEYDGHGLDGSAVILH